MLFYLDSKEKEAIEKDVHLLHEPEVMLPQSISDKEVASKLITNFIYIKGVCSNSFRKDSKPKINFIDEDSFSRHRGIPSMALVLQECLEKNKNDVAILCSSLYEVELVKSALDTLEGKRSIQYIPYLESRLPTSNEKQTTIEKLDFEGNLILISDYRSFRGCETSHSIIITDLEEPNSPNLIAEMVSRTMVDLDFVALPKENRSPHSNQIEAIFEAWETRNYIEKTIVTIEKEDESKIIFQFQSSQRTFSQTCKIPVDGFPTLQHRRKQNNASFL